MTSELHDLLSKMLCMEPNCWISAKQALEHPYFSSEPLPCSKEELKVDVEESHEYLERLKKRSADFDKQTKEEDSKMQ